MTIKTKFLPQIPVSKLNSGTGASAATYFSGANTWASPIPTSSVQNAFTKYSNTSGLMVSTGLLLFEDTLSTTTATPTNFATLSIPIASNSAALIEWRISAFRTGGSAGATGDSAVITGVSKVKNVAGTLTLGTSQQGFKDADQAAWSAALVISSTNLVLQVTGALNNNINWTSSVLVRSAS